jgi:hypothetical protein
VGNKEIQAVFAMSGTDGYMQSAVLACEKAIYGMDEKGELDTFAVQAASSDALAKLYEKHFFPV